MTNNSDSMNPESFRSGPDVTGHFGIFGGRFVAETLMPLILAVEEADCVLFVVNAQEGWTPGDGELYRTLTKTNKSSLYVVVNKVDNRRLEEESFDLYRLGVDKIFPISSEHNLGID